MTTQAKKVLLVDDEEKLLRSIARRMEMLGFVTFTATNGMAAIDIARKHPIDLAIVDLQMPDMNGLVTITKLKEFNPGLRTILLTGHGNDKVRQATESLNSLYFEKDEMAGFWRFIKKLNADGQSVVIRPAAVSSPSRTGGEPHPGTHPTHEIEIHSPPDAVGTGWRSEGLSAGLKQADDKERLRIVGETAAMQELRKNIARVAPLNCPVALRGEPGTGKELAARVIHAGSMLRNQRFLAINCENFGSEKLAGQLLGHLGGNLYEAFRTYSGIFSTGDVGTLFFDQIERMPFRMQDQLLDILDWTDGRRTGDQQEADRDVRILLASEADLAKRADAGSFRKDLYDRLKLFAFYIPPLRERRDDIHPLCRYFFDTFRQELGKAVDAIAPDVVDILVNYDYPGNVGELEHIVERAVILVEGNTIERKHLPVRFLENPNPAGSLATGRLATLAEVEKRHIVQVLAATGGNKSKTAEILGISRAALWRKLKQIKAETAAQ